MKNPSIDSGLFADKVIVRQEDSRSTQEPNWQVIEKQIKTSAAAPEDIEDWAIVVDDSPTCLNQIGHALKSLCIGVHPFRSAQAALDFLHKQPDSDLKKIMGIFSDIEMPEMNGFEFLKALRNDPRFNAIQFVFATSHSDLTFIKQASALKVQGFIVKPIKSEVIIDRVMAMKVAPQKKVVGSG